MSLRYSIFAAALMGSAVTTPAVAGPNWLSIELPANPNADATRGAFFLVRVYHHSNAAYAPISGTAEGLVDGARRSIPLKFRSTDMPGVYALEYSPEKEGAWLLKISLGSGEEGYATALVTLNKQGEVNSVRVPSKQVENGRWTIPTPVTPEQVNQLLQRQVATNATPSSPALAAIVAGLALVPLATRRRKTS